MNDFRRAALTRTPAGSLTVDGNLPWPAGFAPQAALITPAPDESNSLERFAGYDAVVVSWTSAEAETLAALMTPGQPLSSWYEYRHNVHEYIPLVTGKNAPFNDSSPEMKRYYHSMALYMPARIGALRVLCMKSGLHMDYDGPAVPVRKLITEIATTVRPKLFITTGTGGGVKRSTRLGDVVVASHVRFDCRDQFAKEPWAKAIYQAPAAPRKLRSLVTAALTAPNATRIKSMDVNGTHIHGARAHPKIWTGKPAVCVTTDFFAFDDSTDRYGLQQLGRVCDMGDAVIGQVMQDFPAIRWYSIRNASDPQIPNPKHNIDEAGKVAEQVYSRYGGLTTATSVLATWGVICAAIKS